MRREGRQHGMVRSYGILPSPWNPRPGSRFINKFDSPPTAGLFTKVPLKPTNHSKFTGKCGKPRCAECHTHPCCKSKGKAKGTQKLRSHDVVSDHRLMTWRVVDGRPGLNFNAFSATRMLEHLDSESHVDDDDDDDDDDVGDFTDDAYGDSMGSFLEASFDAHVQETVVDEDEDKNEGDREKDDGDDDNLSFCDVGYVLDQLEGLDQEEEEDHEGWCLVGEMR